MNERMAPRMQKITEAINTVINPMVNSDIIVGSVTFVGLDKIMFNIAIGIKKVKIALNKAMLVDCPTTRIVESIPAAIP